MLGAFQSGMAMAERLAAEVARLAAGAGPTAWPVAAIALVAGFALLFAGILLGPLLAGIGGGAVTWVVMARMPPVLAGWAVSPSMERWVAAAAVGLSCAFVPSLYAVVLGALPAALYGTRVPIAGRAWLGSALGALVFGGMALALRRVVLAATAAVPGALLVVGALIVFAVQFPVLTAVTGRPTLLVAIGALLAVAGTAAQVARPPHGKRGRGSPRRGGRRLDEGGDD